MSSDNLTISVYSFVMIAVMVVVVVVAAAMNLNRMASMTVDNRTADRYFQ